MALIPCAAMLSRLRTKRSVTARLMRPFAERMPQILISRPPRKARPLRISNSRVGGETAVAAAAKSGGAAAAAARPRASRAAKRRTATLPGPRQDGVHHHHLIFDAIAPLAVADRLPGRVAAQLRAHARLH